MLRSARRGIGARHRVVTSAHTVTIGVIAPIDGGLTSFGQGIRNSVRLAVQQANASDPIKGWTIKVRVLDDSSDPAKGEAAAKKLAADPTVVAVVGPYNSGVAQSVLPVLAKRGIALVSPSNTLTSLTLGDNAAEVARPFADYFRLVGPDSLQAQFLAVQARARGFSSAAVVSETKAVSQGLADAFADAFVKGGGTVTVQQTVPDGATTFGEFLAAVAPEPPGLLFFGGEYQVAAALRTAATEAGVTVAAHGRRRHQRRRVHHRGGAGGGRHVCEWGRRAPAHPSGSHGVPRHVRGGRIHRRADRLRARMRTTRRTS